MSKVLWHTINIQIPDKMINVSKTGKMTMKQSLTKKGNISKSNNESSVVIKMNPNINKPIIKESGKVENVEAIKLRQKKLKIIKDRLIKLHNKPKTTKAEFVSKAKAKVAPKIQAKKDKPTTKTKLVASDKHKNSNSTYQNLQYAKSFIDAIKKPYKFVKNYDAPNPLEYKNTYEIFKYGKNNIHYVGHKVGTLSVDTKDEFKTFFTSGGHF